MRRRADILRPALCMFLLGFPALCLAQGAEPCGGVFPVAADATIDRNQPTTSLGNEELLEAAGIAAGERRMLLRFDLQASIPPGSTIHGATLELPRILSGSSPFSFWVLPVLTSWDESTVTWNGRPATGPPAATRSMELQHAGASIDLTDVVTEWATGILPSPDFELLSTSSVAEITLGSREAGAGPVLHVACSAPSPQLVAAADADDTVQLQALNQLRETSSRPLRLRLDGGALVSALMGIPTPAPLTGDPLARADWFLDQYRGLLRCAIPAEDLQLSRRSADGLHLFYRQRHAGVPVFPGELGVHLSRDEVVALTGRYTLRIDLDPSPRLDASLAGTLARAAAGAGARTAGTARLTYVDLRTMKRGDQQVHLAWQVTVIGGTKPGTYFVDAVDGRIPLVLPLREDAFVLRMDTGGGAPSWGGDFNICWFPTGADVGWFTETGVIPGASPDAQGFTAFGVAGAIDAYWRGRFGRNSHDGIGGMEKDYVHVNLPGNAQYDSFCNIFEFGENMATRDIMGHEFTHGVIQNEANLVYSDEPGALNESYADLFGFLVDPNNFTIGEGSAAGTLRTLNNPPASCSSTPPDCTQFGVRNCNPDHMLASVSGDQCGKRVGGVGATLDSGWVHTNSSINNKAGALIIAGGTHNGFTVAGMGRAKAERLFNDVITNWLGPNSQFMDARDTTIAAAEAGALFNGQDVCDVKNAYASVGLGVGDRDCDGIDDTIDVDFDNDGIPDGSDNCAAAANSGQQDRDADGLGDACDPDKDGDSFGNGVDNCPVTVNPGQADWDADGVGDACDDSDFDFILDEHDNCRTVVNRDQRDSDGDRVGDACDPDADNDGLPNASDNCPGLANPGGRDADLDGVGDLCDNCTQTPGVTSEDFADPDHDGKGNVCDQDDDGDGVDDAIDNCPSFYNPGQEDFDFNGDGTGCDAFETRQHYEDRRFWELGRLVKWELPDAPLEIPLPICPECPGPLLPHGFTSIFTVQSDVNVSLRVVDREGLTRASDYTFRPDHLLALRPAAYGRSRFDYTGLLSTEAGGPGALASLSGLIRPDQEAYGLLVYPEPGTDITNYHTLQMGVHQCADVDGDGFYAGDETCLALGPADCDDKDSAMFPGNPELCDNKDNDCNGSIDGFATQCGTGVCAAAGFCDQGFDSCQPNPPAPEICDGLDNDCDGLTDNGPPPSAGITVTLSETAIAWDALPDTATWDVAYGSLDLLASSVGDFSVATVGCLAHRTPATEIVDSLSPAPGEGIWVLVRGYNCAGAGSYDEIEAGPRDAEMDASPQGCRDCSHSLCSVGPPLTPTCDACAGYVCSFDAYCCSVLWDALCVEEADAGCGLGCF